MAIVYSVIIPAYNEEELLPETLTALKNAMGSIDTTGEVIVVDNNSTDRTAQVAEQCGARVVFEPFNQISRARNAGGRVAEGRYLIFLDADTLISPELLQTALDNLSGGECCGGGALVEFDRAIPPFIGIFVRLWNWYSEKFNVACGCFVYCLQEAFAAVDGFSEKVYISEEIWFSRRVQAWGKEKGLAFRIITDRRILSSSRKLELSPMLLLAAVLLHPLAIRFRSMGWLWYHRRPNK